MSTCLLWKWYRFAAVVGLSFYGISRPGEPLREFRRSLLLPADLLSDDHNTAYLQVNNTKSGRRGGGRIQHVTIQDAAFVKFVSRVFGKDPPEKRLFACSASAFRRRWDAVLHALTLPKEIKLTPGGLCGGGCVHSFQSGVALPLLLWKMRLKHQGTLENYLQEVVANSVVPSLSPESRKEVLGAGQLFDLLLTALPER